LQEAQIIPKMSDIGTQFIPDATDHEKNTRPASLPLDLFFLQNPAKFG